MEYEEGGKHAEDVTQRDHRIGHAEGEHPDDPHPQQRGGGEEEAADGKLPVDEQRTPELTGPPEGEHPREGELEEHLSPCEQQALENGVGYYFPHRTMAMDFIEK